MSMIDDKHQGIPHWETAACTFKSAQLCLIQTMLYGVAATEKMSFWWMHRKSVFLSNKDKKSLILLMNWLEMAFAQTSVLFPNGLCYKKVTYVKTLLFQSIRSSKHLAFSLAGKVYKSNQAELTGRFLKSFHFCSVLLHLSNATP